ncbi:BlaI/MecI/CopY family transcriptional regulator [Aquimarina litoralis]|uniref:BlaI/MecI/CopY family transcriptional regulator n=1 Tax=Aquimarina litoralis TaxID=584605 RepID=A0ABN1J1K8_9FLAO
MIHLTKAEEQIMRILWKQKTATIKSIIEDLGKPKPAYNTVSTIVRILESKEFVSHYPEGKGYIYFPVLKKVEYTSQSLHKLTDNYFNGSVKSLVSFFIKNKEMDINELEEILKEIKTQ